MNILVNHTTLAQKKAKSNSSEHFTTDNPAISFGKSIKFLPKKEFMLKAKGADYIDSPWDILSTKISKHVYTDEASVCNAGGVAGAILGLKEKVLESLFYHINPCLSDFLKDKDKFIKMVDDFKLQHGNLDGVMTGGFIESSKNHSIKVFKELYNIFEGAKAKLSIIWGQCGDRETHVAYNATEDIWYICCENNYSHKNVIEAADDINRTYNFIHILDGDEVYIGDKKIDKSKLNQISLDDMKKKIEDIVYNRQAA